MPQRHLCGAETAERPAAEPGGLRKVLYGARKEILTRITELRSRTFQPSQEAEQINNGNELSGLLARLQLSVEDYPELKTNEQFNRLMANIEDMELQLQAIRRTYNAAVTDYNNAIEMFPSSIVKRRQGHDAGELIDIPEQEKQNVNVGQLFIYREVNLSFRVANELKLK